MLFSLPSFLLSINEFEWRRAGMSTQSPNLTFVFSSKSREVLGVAAGGAWGGGIGTGTTQIQGR
jgi:hypothetical protein